MSDLAHHFSRNFGVEGIDIACEWLADEGYLHKMAIPVRLTTRSQINVEEAAYSFCEGGST